MFYNTQATDRLVRRLVDLAHAAKIPVVGVTETCPPGLTYQAWMLRQLDATDKALAGPAS
jgi:zinc/manganese transport system substrate-binding protein